VTRAAAIATAARRYLAQGESIDDAIAHAARRVPASPADRAFARRLLTATTETTR
jgi:hypothetical protein